MPFDITDAKDRIEVLEESIQQIITILEKRFPEEFRKPDPEPMQQDVEQLFAALKQKYPERFPEAKPQPPQTPPVIYQGYDSGYQA